MGRHLSGKVTGIVRRQHYEPRKRYELHNRVGGWIQYADPFASRADEIAALGLDYVLIRVIDGRNLRNSGTNLRSLSAKLAKQSIRVFGWGYIYPGSAADAGKLAAERCQALGMEYFSVDFEIEFERLPQKESVAAAKASA